MIVCKSAGNASSLPASSLPIFDGASGQQTLHPDNGLINDWPDDSFLPALPDSDALTAMPVEML